MRERAEPIAIIAMQAEVRGKPSNYPEIFASGVAGREKRALGDIFGLGNFGVTIARLPPQAVSALRHTHSRQDEFVFVLAGRPTLVTNAGDTELVAGMCAGFRASSGDAHMLINRTADDVVYLEVGDRSMGDSVTYPDDDLAAALNSDGHWTLTHKDGVPY